MTGLTPEINEQDLADLFTKFGDIVDIVHKGHYAFVEYSETSYANEAVTEMAKEKDCSI